MAPNLPAKIGQYEVLDIIGRGGMGVVYKAKDPFLDCLVAIKMMTVGYGESPDLRQRFYREAQSTANLRHANIVTVHGGGEHEGNPYLVMEFLEGASLEAILRAHQQLSLLQKVTTIVEVCHGLAYAHQRHIVHRDIKPANIMLLKGGEVKLVDFGIAHIGDKSLTKTGQIIGSLSYMSPEQIQGFTVDQRSDIFSTGVVLYQLITDAVPFEAESTAATMLKIIGNDPPAPFRDMSFPFAQEIQAITFKALAKKPDERYETAEDFALDLTAIQEKLKKESIADHLRQAEVLMETKDLLQAQERLMQVLSIDRQNTEAANRLRVVRKQIQQEQLAERVRQLREMAQDAYRHDDYESSLAFLNQAVSLDNSNPDLRGLLKSVEKAKLDAEFIRAAMDRADAARRSGDLDSAVRALDEALARNPEDTKVRALRRIVEKEAAERQIQKQVNALLDSARKEMDSRRYTSALDLLKQVERLDPSAPQLRPLMEKLMSAHQQEKARKELEAIHKGIDEALHRDDFDAAVALAEEGLQKFPADSHLANLKQLAEAQGSAQRRKLFVRDQLTSAQAMLDAGDAEAAGEALTTALAEAPGDPSLESMLEIVRERLKRDRTESEKSARLAQAQAAIHRRDYNDAIKLLESMQLKFADSSEVDDLLRFAREQALKRTREEQAGQASRAARQCMSDHDYDGAVQVLESALRKAPSDDLSVLLQEARRRRDEFERQLQLVHAKAQQFVKDGAPGKAREFLEAQPAEFARSPRIRELLESIRNLPVMPEVEAEAASATVIFQPRAERTATAATPAREETRTRQRREPAPQPIETLPPPAPKRTGLIIGIVAAAVIAVASVMWLMLPKKPAETVTTVQPKAAPVATVGSVQVRSNVPDADVLVDGQLMGTTRADGTAPITVEFGRHEIAIQKSGYEAGAPQQVEVSSSAPEASVSVELTKTAEAANAPAATPDTYLLVTSNPGAELSVDGRASGRVPNGGMLALRVSPGRHRLEAALSGYETRGERITVKEGERLPVAAELKAKAAPPAQAPSQQTTTVATNTVPSTPPQPPPTATKPANVKAFESGADKILRGAKVKLFWETENASAVSIEPGIGQVSGSGSREIAPDRTTTYTLSATGSNGTVTKSVVVAVEQPPTAQPTPAARGGDEIDATIERFRQEYQKLSLPALLSVWPSMPKKQQNNFKDAFKEFRALQLSFSDCNRGPTLSETIEVSCKMTATYTSSNGRVNPPQTTQARFTLKKSGNGYTIQDVR